MPLWAEILRAKLPDNNEPASIVTELKKLKIRLSVVSKWIINDEFPPDKIILKLAEHYKVPAAEPDKLKQAILTSETLTNRILGAISGVAFSSLGDWLIHKKQPHIKNLNKLSEWLNVPVTALLLENAKSVYDPEVRIVQLLEKLTPEQQQQIVNQMETMIERPGQVPPHF